MTLRTLTLGISALALSSLLACGTAPGQCSTNADCTTGVCDTGSGFCVATCGNTVCGADQTCSNSVCIAKTCASPCTTGQTCELLDGGYSCVQTDCFPACDTSYQECNKTAPGGPTCVATTCHPACAADERCNSGDGGFTCAPVTTGYIDIQSPDGGLFGVSSPLGVTATAGAPGGPTLVELTVQQGSHTPHIDVTVGNLGTYTGTINLADAGLVTGSANVIGAVYWMVDGGEADAGSAPVAIQIDATAPSILTGTTDKAFYSGTASPAQTADVTVPISDIGGAGVNLSSVTLTANGHTYPANSAALPDGGNGNYSFAVPVSALNTSNTFLGTVGYAVTATDKVGNVAMVDAGAIAIDNIPPSFDTVAYDAGTWFGADAGISVAVNVADQTGGSGLNTSSVAVTLPGGNTLTGGIPSGTDTYTFATTGGAIQVNGTQGPVPFGFTAKDNAGNIGTFDGGAILVDELAPTVGATTIGNGTAHASSNGWFAQDGGTIQVTTIINDSNGSGPASATLTVGARAPVTSTVGTMVGNGTSYAFTVPTSDQAVGSETPIALTISGTDAVGNSGTAASATDGSGGAVTLNIDGKAPQIGTTAWAPLTNPNGTDGNGVPWFSQVGGTIDFTATISDSGSGVNPSSVVLQTLAGVTLVGITITPGSGSAASNVYTFFIPRGSNITGLVPTGSQGLVKLQIVAKDNVGNIATAAVPQFGIDGQPPTVSFSSILTGGKLTATTAPAYPSTGSGCATGANGVDYCGHDNAGHFWRKGETNQLTFYGNDGTNGSGVTPNTGSATCNIATSGGCTALTYVSTDPNATASFQTIPDFSKATFTSAADGTGTINVTVTVTDLAENVGTATVAIAVTRVKWASKLLTRYGVNALTGSPIVTSSPTSQIIFGGANNASPGPIVSLGTDGSKLWQAGNTQGITTISSNMAYSPATKLLYVVPNSGASAYAYPLNGSGLAGTGIACNGVGVSRSPSIIKAANGTEYVLVPDDTSSAHRLDAFSVSGTTCSSGNNTMTGSWNGNVYTASTDGTTVYVGHDDSGLAKATFSNGTFGTVVEAAAFGSDINANIAIAGNLFFADANTTAEDYLSYSPITLLPVVSFTAAKGPTNSTVQQPPIIAAGYLFGVFDASHDGKLHAFSPTTGASQFTYPTDSSKIGSISPVTLGADNEIYFSDSTNKEVVALKLSGNTPTVSWNFTGTPAGASAVAVSSVTTEPTIEPTTGMLYFGDSAGDVFALITDSAGPLAPTAGTNWPRVGFDNCNSGNTSFSCQ